MDPEIYGVIDSFMPMCSVFRRSTTLIVVVGEFLMFRKLPSKSCMVSDAASSLKHVPCKNSLLHYTA